MNPDELRRKLGRKQKKSTDAEPEAKDAGMAAQKITRSEEEAAEKSVVEHTVQSGDTLSGIAQKYYGSAAREKWMAIYGANKESIGDNPNLIRVGQTLRIPNLE